MSRKPEFVHLHNHSEYSRQDGLQKLSVMCQTAAADGQRAIAVTDHGTNAAAPKFVKAAEEAGIKPILGQEVYLAIGSRKEKNSLRDADDGSEADEGAAEGFKERRYHHLTVLASNPAGWRSLVRLGNDAANHFWHKPRCLPAGHKIHTIEGVKNIEDVKVGDLVLTHKGRYRRVLDTMANEYDGPLYGVTPNFRYPTTTWLTEGHPVLIADAAGNTEWVEVQDVRTGFGRVGPERRREWSSYLCLPKVAPDVALSTLVTDGVIGDVWKRVDDQVVKTSARRGMPPTRHYREFPAELQLDFDLGFFAGLYLAEGWTDRGRTVSFALHQDETELIERIVRVADAVFGARARVDHHNSRVDYRGVTVSIDSAPLALLMQRLFGTGAANKHLSALVMEANEDFLQGVFGGVLAGDGNAEDGAVRLRQTSEALAWQMRLLGARFTDSFSPVRARELANPSHATQYCSSFTDETSERRHRLTRSDERYVYRPVGRVETKHYSGTVYNFEVEEDNSYVSDFVMHNCDFESLTEMNEGLILGSGCLGGPVASRFLAGDDEGAYRALEDLLAVVGGDKDRLFVEIMSHGIDVEDRLVTPKLIEAAKHFGLRLVASNDAHYTHGCDEADGVAALHYGHGCEPEAHDLLLALGTNAQRDDPKRYRFNGHGYHLRTAAEMDAVFSRIAGAQDAVRNSLAVAEMVEPDVMPEFRYHLPRFDVPADALAEYEERKRAGTSFTSPSHYYLWRQMSEGARERYGQELPEQVRANLNWELKVINDAGMCDYMLITQGVQERARARGSVLGPGRGSAPGSTTAYCLNITDVEPIEHGLLFERFLDPKRAGMPDIDNDFDRAGQVAVRQDLVDTYGDDRVALIGTRGTYKAKGAVRHVGRLTDRSEVGAALAEQVWSKAGFTATIKQLTDPKVPESMGFQEVLANSAEARTLLELARTIEGTRSDVGIHACGVLICDESMLDQVPLRRDPSSGMWVTEWEGPELDDLGYLKLDVLGLRTLDVVSTCLAMMARSGIEAPDITYRGIEVDPATSHRARAAWELIGAGNTDGVFQLASDGMKRLAQQVQPQSLADLSALVALYRPGPMGAGMHEKYGDRKHGREEVSYDYLTTDPREQEVIASVLDNTLGLIVYQESVMQLAGVVAGFGPSAKNKLRKAFSKKKPEEMAALKQVFLDGAERATEDGEDSTASIVFQRSTADNLWVTFEASASYLFNASHSAAYGFVGYITAFLKANWPSHFGAATLATTTDDTKRAAILGSLRSAGIEVRPPSVVDGQASTWVADDGAVVLGLAEVDGVGDNAAAIIAEREANGPFTSLSDLVNRVRVVTKRPSVEKTETKSITTEVCHRCLGLVPGVHDEADAATFETCACSVPLTRPNEDHEPVVRTWTEDGDVGVELQVVSAGTKNFRLRRTERRPVLDEHGEPVMDESWLSLGIVESLIRAGACDAFGPRLGMLAVVRALREMPDLPVPDVEVGIIERERVAAAKLGVTIGEGPFGHRELGRAVLDWEDPDPLRQAGVVGVHRVRHPGWYLVGGVLDHWSVRYTRKGTKMANFRLSDSKGSMDGVMWESGLEDLERDGLRPSVGDVVVVSARAKDRTITRTVQSEDAAFDTETGEEYEAVTETVTVRELSAEKMWIFPGDVAARPSLPPATTVPIPRIHRTGDVLPGGLPDIPLAPPQDVEPESESEPEPEPEPARPRVISVPSGFLRTNDLRDVFPEASLSERSRYAAVIKDSVYRLPGGVQSDHEFDVSLPVPGGVETFKVLWGRAVYDTQIA